jgi:hypothetical protein
VLPSLVDDATSPSFEPLRATSSFIFLRTKSERREVRIPS